MSTKGQRQERGQTMVILALAMTVLMLMAGLAVDVGMAYNERRDLQNAADAAALAGAQQLCQGWDDATAISMAETMGTANGAEQVEATVTRTATELRVRAVARDIAETFFFRIVGISGVPVSASATAECSCAGGAGGFWPLAFDYPTYHNELGCGDRFMVLAGPPNKQFKLDSATWCSTEDNPMGPCDCLRYELAHGLPQGILDDIVIFGAEGVASGEVGWVTLGGPSYTVDPRFQTGNNCGGDALKTWLQYGYQGLAGIGQCAPAKSGLTDGSEDDQIPADAIDISALKLGHELPIILFDPDRSNDVYCTEANNVTSCSYGSSDKRYYFADFGCIHVEYVDNNFILYEPYPKDTEVCQVTDPPKPTKVEDLALIMATKVCDGCPYTSSGWAAGGGDVNSGCILAVSLVE